MEGDVAHSGPCRRLDGIDRVSEIEGGLVRDIAHSKLHACSCVVEMHQSALIPQSTFIGGVGSVGFGRFAKRQSGKTLKLVGNVKVIRC